MFGIEVYWRDFWQNLWKLNIYAIHYLSITLSQSAYSKEAFSSVHQEVSMKMFLSVAQSQLPT